MRLSANLGFLWSELDLPGAVRAAKAAGFDAVECHWPYSTDPDALRAALTETGMPLIGLNTEKGDSFGRCALDADQAQRDIDQALEYGTWVGAQAAHVMAGISDDPRALDVFCESVAYASGTARPRGMTVLIEPLNSVDVPGYALGSFEAAEQVLARLAQPNVKIMLDCYHARRMGLDPLRLFNRLGDKVGHIQFANDPDRGAPQADMIKTLQALAVAGWDKPFGAEYKPDGPTGDSLGWMKEVAE